MNDKILCISFVFTVFCVDSVPVNAKWWNPFAANDYEGCIEESAKEAKNEKALELLVEVCATKFIGRRNPMVEGGYIYISPITQDSYVLERANPSDKELAWIKGSESKYEEDKIKELESRHLVRESVNREKKRLERKQQLNRQANRANERAYATRILAEQKRTSRIAENRRRVAFGQVVLTDSVCCDWDGLHVTIQNNSSEIVTSVSVGYQFFYDEIDNFNASEHCPKKYVNASTRPVQLQPGDTMRLEGFLNHYERRAGDFKYYCTDVTSATFSGL